MTGGIIIVAAPVFQTRNLQELLSVGEYKKIILTFSGLPVPDVEWRFGDSLVRGMQIDSTGTSTSILIKEADRKKHAGSYNVSLRNKAGVATTDVRVDVIGKLTC